MAECGYCGIELPDRDRRSGRPRLYCTDSHRVMASRLRTAETAADEVEGPVVGRKEAH